jgi:hypothetical protein
MLAVMACVEGTPSLQNGAIAVVNGDRSEIAIGMDTSRNGQTIEITRGPDSLIVKLAEVADSFGNIPDTARIRVLRLYRQFGGPSVVWSAGRPFYHLKEPLTEVRFWNDRECANGILAVDTTGTPEILDSWAYFYRDTAKVNNIIPDGVIAIWRMTSKEAADQWLQILKGAYPLPYFNTMPHYFVIGDRLVALSTRAMSFSYDQISVYKECIARFHPTSIYSQAKLK